MHLPRRRRSLPAFNTLFILLLVITLAATGCAPQAPQIVEVPEARPTNTQPASADPTPTEPQGVDFSPSVPLPSEPVTLTFASWVGGSASYQFLADEFHNLYPNITVKFEEVGFEEMYDTLMGRVESGRPPDVAYMSTEDVGAFAGEGALLALDPYIEFSMTVAKDDYVEAFLSAAMSDGKVYGLPIAGETTGLFYRTDLFEAAGLDPAKPPETWDQFLDYAQKLTLPEQNQYGFALFAPEAAYYWYPWLWQAGGELITADGQDVLWDNEAGLRAAEFYVALKDYSPPGYLDSNSWDGRVAFVNGSAAMYEVGAWFAGVLQSEHPELNGKWATAPMPTDQRCATTIAGDALVIFKGSKNADAAWKWIEFLSAPENMALINLGTPEAPSTMLPPRASLINNPTTYANNPVLRGFALNMSCAYNFTTEQEQWGEMEELLNQALSDAMHGQADARTALQQAAAEAEALIK